MDANLTVVTKNTIYTSWLTMTSRQIDCIKIVAFLAMIADHANTALSLHNGWLMLIGRMAFPLFALIWGINQARHPEIKQSSLNRLWLWAVIAQPCYYLVVMNAGTAFWQLNILFTFAVAGQSLKWFRSGVTIKHIMAMIIVMAYLPLSLTSYFIFGLLLLWCSRWLFISKNSGRILTLWCLIVILLNIHILAIVAFGGLVLTIVVWAIFGGLKSEGRILPKNFFLYGYAAHLLILGGVALCL
ncbi:type-F conjugative transfer system pilin acetylase TraX [Budviciaceae bacterium BWR-B9]|uniref:Type-F conjugative transfer system pilin acetylase TraX n=1 Tax=Limnobaculum allomyrinae TaxID=2791986 RepID=A0ABS1IVG2_9GAMM|nr:MULTISPECIES: type-F conjugative transfer system pilin acetylase TraX [Limnobaculum]MBK5145531.1 type-F conjugative transfer system pilin acetylase TraX [Limnobaculum allomyrinae]MBV7693650.1 type-F conjugative transfer system pilin acetylase TraX [Limnobaculum sp. M2-1]